VIAVPTDKDQCKNNGWKTLSGPMAAIQKPRRLIQYVNTGK